MTSASRDYTIHRLTPGTDILSCCGQNRWKLPPGDELATDENLIDCPGLESRAAALGFPVKCPHCGPDAGPIPPTHWTKHLMRHHPESSTTHAPAPVVGTLRDQITEAIHATSVCEVGDPVHCGGGCRDAADAVLAVPAIRDMEGEIAALRQVARGYCPECGRGDAAPTVDDWQRERQRADQAEELLRVAHETSNKSEAERARAAQRAKAAIRTQDKLAEELDQLRHRYDAQATAGYEMAVDLRKAEKALKQVQQVIADMKQTSGTEFWVATLEAALRDPQEPS